MSHTIIAYKDTVEIAILNFGATNFIMSSYVYKILDAEDFNNGVSGNGCSKYYSDQDILRAKAALGYYEQEPLEMVRNIKNEQQAAHFISNLPGINDVTQECFSTAEITEGISSIRDFLVTILNAYPAANIEINFG